MKYLEKDYYVGLLNAADYYEAAHQQPQSYTIITKRPSLRNIQTTDLKVNFYIKKDWSKEDILQNSITKKL